MLQVLGLIGTPFGVGTAATATTAGTLATILPLFVGLFGAADGFKSLKSGARTLIGSGDTAIGSGAGSQ